MLIRVTVLLMALALLAVAGAGRAQEADTVTARGYGEDPEQAVINALVAAVRQGGGVTLAVDPDFRRQVSNWVVERDGDVTTWIGNRTSVAEPRLPTLGSLESYRVTDLREENGALWRADVEARLLRERQIGPDREHLPAIVVAPLRARDASYTLGDTEMPAGEASRRLRADLEQALAQSGRFRVLDRAHLDQREEELEQLARGSVEAAERVRLGKASGADLLLVGTIEAFDIGDRERTFYGASFRGYEPYVRVRYRLIHVAGGEVLAADVFDWRQSEESVRDLARRQNLEYRDHPERLADLVYPRIARALAAAASDALYPVRILKAHGDQVYLSQGQGRLEKDALLNVYRPVETVDDPDTGLPIQLQSDALATLRVTEVRPGYAVARVSQSKDDLRTGDLVRPAINEDPGEDAPAGQADSPGSAEMPIRWD